MRHFLLFLVILILSLSCSFPSPTFLGENRTFTTSFESLSDFTNFYITPLNSYDSNQELSTELAIDGQYSHKAWIVTSRADNNDGLEYKPHRAYPTIQLDKIKNGIFRTPCLISLWVYLDINLQDRNGIDDWFSFITLSPDTSDNWSRTVLVNIVPDGYIRLVHVPDQGKQEYIYQVNSESDQNGLLLFPYRTWVRLDILIDFDPKSGYAKLWQNGILVSHAKVNGGNNGLAQAHFGLYASAAIQSGTIYNDKLRIIELSNEQESIELVNTEW
jgi:hypothetical protein